MCRDLVLLNGQDWLARTYSAAMALGPHPEASLSCNRTPMPSMLVGAEEFFWSKASTD